MEYTIKIIESQYYVAFWNDRFLGKMPNYHEHVDMEVETTVGDVGVPISSDIGTIS